jgi:poly(hydroxyalkanoate) depolymerase family esterase
MKLRLLDAIGDAMNLVKKSNVLEATALLRKALSGGGANSGGGDSAGSSSSPAQTFVPPPRRRLGDVLHVLRDARSIVQRHSFAPETAQTEALDERFISRNFRSAAGSLNYRLYLPADRSGRDLSLLLMLHGCTQNPEDFAVGTQMNALADEFGLIVAYPRQPRSANPSSCWNWFDKRHQQRGAGEPAKLAGLAQALAGEFGVRKEQIFAAGLSAGGAMAEVLAATYPDVFNAIGVHSGLAYQAASDVPSALAAMKGTAAATPTHGGVGAIDCRKIIFHGGSDATVHPANAERILDQVRSGSRVLKQIDLDWEIEGGRVNRTVLQDNEGRAVVEQWFVEGGGHAWFGGDSRGTYTQKVGLDASRVMVRFFLKQ